MACPVDWRAFDRMSGNPSTTTGPLDVHAGISDTDQSDRGPSSRLESPGTLISDYRYVY